MDTIEILLQWMYASRNKRTIHRLIVTLIVVCAFVMGISLTIYIALHMIITNQIVTNIICMKRIIAIISCVVVIILLSNAGARGDGFSRILLSYYFLIKKRKNENIRNSKFVWIRTGLIIFFASMLLGLMFEELIIWSNILSIKTSEVLVLGFVIIALCIYLPLTEFIIDKVQYYKVQAIASFILFLLMIIIYVTSVENITEYDIREVSSILIFSIGQLAFAVNAISSYKNMYRLIKEKYKKELSMYLQETDRNYEYRLSQISEGINGAKQFAKVFEDFWRERTGKQRLVLMTFIIGGILLYVLLVMASIKLSGI